MRDLSTMKYPATSQPVVEFLRAMLAPHIKRAVEMTPTMLHFGDTGFHWPTDLHGNPLMYFALPHMLTKPFGYSGPCNVKWQGT